MKLTAELLWIPSLLVLFITIHEMGHVAMAKLLNLRLQKVGFTRFPFPHVFVEVAWPRNKRDRILFLMSGFMTILTLLTLALIAGLDYRPLLIAFGIQIMIETNPIYSDFVILSITDKVSAEVRKTQTSYKTVYKQVYDDYIFSLKWYIHFGAWAFLVVSIVQLLK